MAYITVDTKLVVLLGTPLRQSVSYLAQNRVYERLGLDYYYIPVEVKIVRPAPYRGGGIEADESGWTGRDETLQRDDSAVFGRHG